MSRCRWDREHEAYMRDGEECKRDEYGDPTTHCTARRSCGNHIGHGELTCARCLGRTRMDIRAIVTRSCDLMPEALETGSVNTELVNLAGPAADPRAFESRQATGRAWIYANIRQSARDWCADTDCNRRHFKTSEGNRWHKRGIENALTDLLAETDPHHPFSVLTRWQWDLTIAYKHPEPDVYTTTGAADYLERTLPRLAQDPDQDFAQFAREIHKCRSHLETALSDSTQPERGAPCPMCTTPAPRLTLEHGHWCADPDCTRLHYPEEPDRWTCPRNREHTWTEADYRRWVADVYEASRSAG